MDDLFIKIKTLITEPDISNSTVSSSSIYWQLDHSLRVIFGISKSLIESNPKDLSKKFNFAKLYVMTSGSIPRGRSKAPKQVVAVEEINNEQLVSLFEKTVITYDEILSLPPKSNFKHPIFGMLDLKESIKFMGIHTRHHLKIVADIKKS